MVLPALKQGGYTWQSQAPIGKRISGGKHIVDVLATDPEGANILISLKWQQVSGTAEQKVPFEIISLADSIENTEGTDFVKAYLVLGGPGWKLRDFYIRGGLNKYLQNVDAVHVKNLDEFVALANQGRL